MMKMDIKVFALIQSLINNHKYILMIENGFSLIKLNNLLVLF